jgi:hypothetical protein
MALNSTLVEGRIWALPASFCAQEFCHRTM